MKSGGGLVGLWLAWGADVGGAFLGGGAVAAAGGCMGLEAGIRLWLLWGEEGMGAGGGGGWVGADAGGGDVDVLGVFVVRRVAEACMAAEAKVAGVGLGATCRPVRDVPASGGWAPVAPVRVLPLFHAPVVLQLTQWGILGAVGCTANAATPGIVTNPGADRVVVKRMAMWSAWWVWDEV